MAPPRGSGKRDEVNQGAIPTAFFKKAFGIFLFTMGKIVFITGGARSGKSSFALKEASAIKGKGGSAPCGKKAFVATLEPLDEEMKARMERHKKERGAEWDTHEEPLEVPELLRKLTNYDVILIDCLTLWLSNIMLKGKDIEVEMQNLVSAIQDLKNTPKT